LVARREIRESARSRSFAVTTLLLVLAVAVGVVLPAALAGSTRPLLVGVVGGRYPASAVLAQAGRLTGTPLTPVEEPDLARARSELDQDRVSLVFVPGKEVLLPRLPDPGATPSSAAVLARAIAQLDGERALLSNVPPQVAAALERGAALPVRGLRPQQRTTSLKARVTGFVTAVLIYALLLSYGMRLTNSAHEEKSSRVVEVLLATLRPSQLLLGKVLGTGLLFGGQLAAMVAVAFAAGLASGSAAVQGAAPAVIAVAAICLLVGYAFYCTTFAAAGAMVNRQADLFNVTLPIQIPLFVGYIVADAASFSSVGALGRVLAFLPPTAPVVDPALYAAGELPLWQFALSVALCVAGVVAVARLATVVYASSVLHTGPRLRLRSALGRGTR
jgi:ABC-2 type transport system permease protein